WPRCGALARNCELPCELAPPQCELVPRDAERVHGRVQLFPTARRQARARQSPPRWAAPRVPRLRECFSRGVEPQPWNPRPHERPHHSPQRPRAPAPHPPPPRAEPSALPAPPAPPPPRVESVPPPATATRARRTPRPQPARSPRAWYSPPPPPPRCGAPPRRPLRAAERPQPRTCPPDRRLPAGERRA